MTIDERYEQVIERFPPYDESGTGRWCLIEQSRYDGSYYVSRHETEEDAARAHDNQEYVEDWSALVLIDLATGEEYAAQTEYRTSFFIDPDPARRTYLTS